MLRTVTGDCPQERKAKACYKCGDEGHLVRTSPSAHMALSSKALTPLSLLNSPASAPRTPLVEPVTVEEDTVEEPPVETGLATRYVDRLALIVVSSTRSRSPRHG